jgi:hypothetical protein
VTISRAIRFHQALEQEEKYVPSRKTHFGHGSRWIHCSSFCKAAAGGRLLGSGADLKQPEFEATDANEFEILDLPQYENCLLATRGGIEQVYNLAADMGGIGFITASHAAIARNNIPINAHMLEARRLQTEQRHSAAARRTGMETIRHLGTRIGVHIFVDRKGA